MVKLSLISEEERGGKHMKNQITFKDAWGKTFILVLSKGSYSNGNTAIILDTIEGEPFATLSVNIAKLPPEQITVDINNCSLELIQALLNNNVLTLTERKIRSGFCEYPIANITQEWLEILPELA